MFLLLRSHIEAGLSPNLDWHKGFLGEQLWGRPRFTLEASLTHTHSVYRDSTQKGPLGELLQPLDQIDAESWRPTGRTYLRLRVCLLWGMSPKRVSPVRVSSIRDVSAAWGRFPSSTRGIL